MTDLETLETQGFFGLLGFRLEQATRDQVVIGFDVRPELLQPYGIVHGGVHSAAVESAASVAAALWLGDRGRVVGVTNRVDFIRSAREGHLTATATPIDRNEAQQLWLVEIRDSGLSLIARGEVRLQTIAR